MQNKYQVLAFISASYVSGAERVSFDVLKGLRNKGVSILTVTNGWNNGEFSSMLQKEGLDEQSVKLGWYYLTKPMWTLDSLLNAPKAFRTYIRILRDNPKATIYTSGFQQVYLLRPWLKNRKIIVHIHDSFSGNKKQAWFVRKIESFVFKFVAISSFIKEDLIKCGVPESKITVVYNGIDVPEILSPKKDTPFFRFGIVGQLIPRKGHSVLFEALSILKSKLPTAPFQLSIIGKGSEDYSRYLRKQAEGLGVDQLISWEGYKPTKEAIYQNLDTVVAPSSVEPFGLITVEANSYQVPVIAFNHSGFKETIETGRNGWLVEPFTAQELADAMIRALSNKAQSKLMGEKGRAMVQSRFSIQQMIDGVYTLI